MAFDPTKPVELTPLDAAEMRGQLNGLKELIDAVPAGPPGLPGPPGPNFSLCGEWQAQAYAPGDVVVYNGQVYVAMQMTSGAPDVDGAWKGLSIVGPAGAAGATGAPGPNFAMLGDWLDYQTYVPGDVVAYGGQIYVIMSGASGTPPDQGGSWRLLSITGAPGAPGEVSTYQLNETVRTQASRSTDAVQFIDSSSFSAEGQAIVAKLNELISVLKNPV